MTQPIIYLDNNATTPVDPRVLEAMLPYFSVKFGNAASSHPFGWEARLAVENARRSLAACLNAHSPGEIVFTSGATESDNLAIKGVAEAFSDRGNHIITAKTEHKAVLDSCHHLEKQGFHVTYLEVPEDGLVDLNLLAEAITEKTILVTLMAGNNEIGVLQDVAAIGKLCRERGVLFHSDATQAIGKIPFDVQAMHVDLASFTAHKFYGPKGAGGLYVRREGTIPNLIAQTDGGGHEGGYRSGTLNVTGIVGLAKALELCVEEQKTEIPRLIGLRERLKTGLQSPFPHIVVNGHETQRLPGHLSLSFANITGDDLLQNLPDIAASTISACSSGKGAASHVLSALGYSNERAFSTVRFGIGRFNTSEEIEYTIGRISEVIRKATES